MTSTETPAQRSLLSRRTTLLAAATVLVGAAAAGLTARSDTGFRDVLEPVQIAMSVLVPFFGVLAVTGLHGPPAPRPDADRRLTPRLVTAVGLAAGFALSGVLLAAVATGLAGGGWPPASRTAALLVGAVLVQVIAQLVGTGCGLLLRRPGVAMAATIVVPMGVTGLLGAIDSGGGLVRWFTPYGNAQALLAGEPTAALGVVVLLWCVTPNVVGAVSRARPHRAVPDRA
ncbi:hypothetical protein [Paractinoplanes toevensis]|uniref:Uncharacterized protein n=1 Tax=Paractinoplanes toevensis TaxID=571911 RepID=A0A919T3T5_9ACTN|nr:hypothetical protein [Actinoplanes toevensis]GIM88378.1 hypothetical protein Ato02nite_001710 [Actinoplanes toevensis]